MELELKDKVVVVTGAGRGIGLAVAQGFAAAAWEFGSRGIRVNTVDPGPAVTDLWLGADGVASTIGKRHASSRAANITGTNVIIDGGMVTTL